MSELFALCRDSPLDMLKLFTVGWSDYFKDSVTVIAWLCNFVPNIYKYSLEIKCFVEFV